MLRSPFVAIFREVFFEAYITKTTKTKHNLKILSFKYVIQSMLKCKIQIKLFVLNYVGMKCSCTVCVVSLAKYGHGVVTAL